MFDAENPALRQVTAVRGCSHSASLQGIAAKADPKF